MTIPVPTDAASEMIKRVAFHLRAAGGLHNPDDAETLAHVAIAAMRDPTDEMWFAIDKMECEQGKTPGVSIDTWQAMIDAALTLPPIPRLNQEVVG